MPGMCSCSNYILTFPETADAADRMLLLSALFQIDYAKFEREGGDDH